MVKSDPCDQQDLTRVELYHVSIQVGIDIILFQTYVETNINSKLYSLNIATHLH